MYKDLPGVISLFSNYPLSDFNASYLHERKRYDKEKSVVDSYEQKFVPFNLKNFFFLIISIITHAIRHLRLQRFPYFRF